MKMSEQEVINYHMVGTVFFMQTISIFYGEKKTLVIFTTLGKVQFEF